MYLLCVIGQNAPEFSLKKGLLWNIKKWYFSLLVRWAYDRYKVGKILHAQFDLFSRTLVTILSLTHLLRDFNLNANNF